MMFTIHLILIVQIYTFCRLFHGVNAFEASPSAQLQPDGFFALGDYEVISTRQEGDEDVVHIRKRGDEEDCETDCLEYNGSTDSASTECPPEDEDLDDALGKRSHLVKRRKEAS
jgi:hypothetical protein